MHQSQIFNRAMHFKCSYRIKQFPIKFTFNSLFCGVYIHSDIYHLLIQILDMTKISMKFKIGILHFLLKRSVNITRDPLLQSYPSYSWDVKSPCIFEFTTNLNIFLFRHLKCDLKFFEQFSMYICVCACVCVRACVRVICYLTHERNTTSFCLTKNISV